MSKTPEQIRAVTRDIAEAIFRSIDLDATYIVIKGDAATKFTTDRLLKGLPNAFVTQDLGPPVPIRDYGIYRVADVPARYNDIQTGWASSLVEAGVAEARDGISITTLDIWACAKMEVFLRLQAEEET